MSGSLVEIFRYTLPLTRPLLLKGESVMQRSGLILRFGYGEREVGFGEIAPLPGFSRETLEEAQAAAIRWARALGRLPKDPAEREEALGFLRQAPSAAFGIECATANFRHAIGSPYSLGLFSDSRKRIPVNGLLSGALEEVAQRAQTMRTEGYRAVKLKVGRQSIEQDAEMTREVRRLLGAGVALRLDANRAWAFEAALAFARLVANCAIEYIEEPLTEPGRLREFAERSSLNVALDETLAEQADLRGFLADKAWVKAVIIKPTLLGGIIRCGQAAYEALEFGLRPVVSSCFESGLGLTALAHFAGTITLEDIPVGLDTYDWLAADVLERRFAIRNGMLDLDELDACAATINTEALERVYEG